MPELPEVEVTCRRLAPQVTGKRIRAAHVLRAGTIAPQTAAGFAQAVSGRTIRAVRRRGKNIILDLSGGYAVRIHLRMTGELFASEIPDITPAVRVWFELGGRRAIVFRDSRALGRISVGLARDVEKQLDALGPEPLSSAFTAARFLEQARASRMPSKLFLMDQTHVVGLGNIYAAESLWRARIDPRKPVLRNSPSKIAELYRAIRDVLRDAIKSVTLEYKRPGKYRETSSFTHGVYGKEGEGCPRCGHRIRRIVQGGRSTYFCPNCQK